MVKAPVHIGLVGCGSRGLSIFERLLSRAEERPQQPVVIDIFEPKSRMDLRHPRSRLA